MCSDCGLRPAAAVVSEGGECDDLEASTPPETYQEEILEQMIVDEEALNRMLNKIVDMTDIMDLDEDMDDWEPENEDMDPSHDVQSSTEKSVST